MMGVLLQLLFIILPVLVVAILYIGPVVVFFRLRQSANLMNRRRYFWLGVRLSCGGVLCVAAISLLSSYAWFNGDCGRGDPFFLWGRDYQPCSFLRWAYWYLFLFSIWYWYISLGILLIPLVGYLIDRLRIGFGVTESS